jgi:hypothetical protein
MCACKETDVRESPNVSIFGGGKSQGSRRETGYAIFVKNPVSSLLERTVYDIKLDPLVISTQFNISVWLAMTKIMVT